jgi:biopolymer transport protein TolQ
MNPEIIHVAIANTPTASDFSIWEAVTQGGVIGLSTLGMLLLFSIISWGIIVSKHLSLQKAQNQSIEFLETFWQSKRLDEIYGHSDEMVLSPVAQVFRAGYQELIKVKKQEKKSEDKQVLLGGAENIERALRRAATAEMTQLERLVPFLATVGSTAPFIGLFGTVVGIINSFADIARFQSASLTTVAPGIAEALVATAGGLLAAIPAVIFFNYFNSQIKVLGHEMENFSSDFMNIVRRHFF